LKRRRCYKASWAWLEISAISFPGRILGRGHQQELVRA
jgi:hypothetical protein